tara:strand:+ start:603 stop:839 length:237 start_codon:yes stop_codon:yes gene_type:complete
MDALNILAYILLLYIGLILAGLLCAMVMGFVACMINERKNIFWCFYCEKKREEEKSIELPKIVIIIEPNGQKKLGIKN